VKVVEFREQAGLERLRPEWEKLLGRSAADTIFLTYEWLNSWWTSFGKPGDLRILTAWDDAGVLRGIAPLRLQRLCRSGQSVDALVFLGDGSTDSDYLDFIIERGYEQPVLDAFRAYWTRSSCETSVTVLNEVPAVSPNLPILKSLAQREGMLWNETDVPCGTVLLPASWDDYLGLLKPRFRTHIRSVLRNLQNRPEVKFGFCDSAGELDRLLDALFDLHTRRWAAEGVSGVFSREGKRDFYHTLSAALLDRGRLRLSWMEWNGRILACQYGFVYNRTYSQLQEGYEPASAHFNCGVGLRAWSIRTMIEEGVREYDFLGGMGRHKTDWGAQIKYSKRVVLARDNWKNLVFCRGGTWRDRSRKLLSNAAFRKFIAASQPANGHAEKPSATNGSTVINWRRRAMATTYFNLGFPALVRPFRERFQVSTSGGGSKLSLTRRRQPSARILYYHRVNDDADAFFPAISTRLFEQEMRHLARHYKVVPMPELIRHLEDGPPETVVAITFDDGYRDNYENAFPILRRYGLPATVFLATGTMDSAEPIWFEQLAEAVKNTSREQLDLEIDIPRRFSLRTEAERLEANNGIFAVLRDLPDVKRREWLPRICKQLDLNGDAERRGKMLTWDQARAMSSGGITFGGHTVTHPFLSRLTRDQASWEASECKRRIECELQLPVECFAYPNGREEDVGPWGGEVIRAAGYRAAVTTIWGMNYGSTDSMLLKRGGPWEETQALFAHKLDWYQLTDD